MFQDPILIAKPDNDLRDTEKERLDPELEQLMFIGFAILICDDLLTGLQLNPVGGLGGVFGFAVPYFMRDKRVSSGKRRQEDGIEKRV